MGNQSNEWWVITRLNQDVLELPGKNKSCFLGGVGRWLGGGVLCLVVMCLGGVDGVFGQCGASVVFVY